MKNCWDSASESKTMPQCRHGEKRKHTTSYVDIPTQSGEMFRDVEGCPGNLSIGNDLPH